MYDRLKHFSTLSGGIQEHQRNKINFFQVCRKHPLPPSILLRVQKFYYIFQKYPPPILLRVPKFYYILQKHPPYFLSRFKIL